MNRREMYQQVVAAAESAGVLVDVETVDADTKPALVLIEVKKSLPMDAAHHLGERLEQAILPIFGKIPILVLDQGATLTFLDANGRPLNRTSEDA